MNETTTTTTTTSTPTTTRTTNLVNLFTTNTSNIPSYTTINTNSNNNSRSQRRYVLSLKKTERNYLSAFCSIFCIAVLIVSLIETRWFYINGGGCNLNYLGISYFFATGHLETHIEQSRVAKYDININNYILKNGSILRNCTNSEILLIMRLIIAFIFFAILSSFIGLILDSFGFMKNGIKLIRRHAIFHILTVIICLIINGFCFWISERIYEQQYLTRFKKGKKIDVQFDVSYYLIVFASLLSILSTACTLIRRYPVDDDDDNNNGHLNRILNEFTGGYYFDDPIDMQRSLPSTTIPSTSVNNNNNDNDRIISTSQQQQLILSPPPPPPPLPSSINITSNPIEIPINEPPPPYLLDTDNDTAPLIV